MSIKQGNEYVCSHIMLVDLSVGQSFFYYTLYPKQKR